MFASRHGSVLYKWVPSTPAANLWEFPDLQGSLTATAGPNGQKIGDTRIFNPDGTLETGTHLDAGPGNFDHVWLAGHQRALEHHDDLQPIIQLGARLYHPGLARFLSVDPIEAGVNNDYNYPSDPINQTDLTGMSLGWAKKQVKKVASHIRENAGAIASRAMSVALASTCVAAGAASAGVCGLVCFGAAAAMGVTFEVGVGVTFSTDNERKQPDFLKNQLRGSVIGSACPLGLGAHKGEGFKFNAKNHHTLRAALTLSKRS